MLQLCGMRSTPSLPSLSGPFWHEVIAPVSHLGHLLGEFYPSAEKQSVYSTAQADWAKTELFDHLAVC